MEAVPLAAAAVMVKLGVESPSAASVKLRVPVMVTSSAPEPEVSPVIVAGSSTAATSKVMVLAD